jgi:hypothetical protein
MLPNTFCHLVGIGPKKERALWDDGMRCWDDVKAAAAADSRAAKLARRLEESHERFEQRDARWFHKALSSAEEWRVFRDFRNRCAYLDIETTGLGGGTDHITSIALYDGADVHTYVHGINLDEFREDIGRFDLLVTYNGKTFDLPFIRQTMGLPMQQAHIDLRYVLARLGYKGGLKGCEKALGLDRGELDGVDGYFAVLLWQEYLRHDSAEALETMLAYNAEDVVNLEPLMLMAWNMLLTETPFAGEHRLEVTPPAPVPHTPHIPTVHRLKRRMGAF